MRAFTLISGLFLTTAVLAAPTPRPSDDVTDANPFNTGLGKRLDLPTKLPLDLPTGDLTKGLPVGDIASVDGAKKQVDGLTKDLPIKVPTGTDLSSLTGAKKQVDDLTKDLPIKDLPVKIPTGGDLSSVTGAVSPVLKAVGSLLSTALSSLTKADEGVKNLIKNSQSNVSTLVSGIQGHINSAAEEVQNAIKALGVDPGNVQKVRSIAGQVQGAAEQLVKDLGAVDSSLPGVPDLVSSAKGLVELVQGIGL